MGNFYEDWKARNGYGSNPKTTDGPKQETPNKSDPKSSSNDFYEKWKSRNGYGSNATSSYDRVADYNHGVDVFNYTMDGWNRWYEASKGGLESVGFGDAGDAYASIQDEASSMLKRLAQSRKWAQENKDQLGDNYDAIMKSLQEATTATYWMNKGYENTAEYFGQWDSQEAYDQAFAPTEQEVVMGKDVGQMQSDLDAMRQAYDDLDEILVYREAGYGTVPEAEREQKKAWHDERYQEILDAYGVNGNVSKWDLMTRISELEDEIGETSETQEGIRAQNAEANRLAGYYVKYSGMDYGQLKQAMETVTDPQEKAWLHSFAGTKMTAADYDAEIASTKEQADAMSNYIDVLNARYEELDTAIANYSTSSDPEDAKRLTTAQKELDMVLRQLRAAEDDYDALMTRAWQLDHDGKYAAIRESADFDEKSGFVTSFVDADGNVVDTTNDSRYRYINSKSNPDAFLQPGTDNYSMDSQWIGSSGGHVYGYMNEDEVKTYNYIVRTQGWAAANDYLEEIRPVLDERMTAGIVSDISDITREAPVFANALSVGMNLTAGQGILDIAAQNVGRKLSGSYKPVNYYGNSMTAAHASKAIRGTTAAMITDATGTIQLDEEKHPILAPILNGRGLADVYQLGMSAIDSRVAGMFGSPVLASVLQSSSAATQGVLDALERGATDEQALQMGLWNGAFEAVFEYFEVDNLLKGNPNWVKNVVNQAITEGLGEGGTTLANNIADAIIMADKSAIAQAEQEYIDQGMDPKKAREKALIDASVDLLWDTIGGAVSGGFAAGGQSLMQNYSSDMASGRYVQDKQIQDPLMQLAQSMAGANTGKLDAYAQRAAERQSTRNMGRLYNEVNRVVDRQNMDQLAQALEGQGLSRKDATHLATAIGLDINGIELTKSQEKLLKQYEDSEKVMAAVEEVLGSTAFLERNARVRNLGTTQKKTPTAAQEAPGQAKAETQTTMPEAKIETAHAVSEDGKTHLIEEPDKAVSIQGIESIKDGKMMLKLEDGSVVDSDSVSYASADEAMVYLTLAEMGMDVNAAQLLASAFKTADVSGEAYSLGIREAYRFGMNNDRTALSRGYYSSALTEHQRDVAFKMGKIFGGQQTAKEEASIRKAKAEKRPGGKHTGQVHFERNGRSFDAVRETALKTMEQLAAALGVEFYVFESYVDKNGRRVYKNDNGDVVKAPNGWYDTETGTIHIDLNAGADGKGTMLFTVAHELTHFIRQWSSAKFKVLANFLVKQYNRKDQSIEDLIVRQIAKAKENGRTIDRDTAFEEVVADSMESMLADGNVVQMMADLKQQDKTLWQKIVDWFKELAEDLKKLVDAYKDAKPDSPEGRMVADMQDVIIVLEAMYADALVEAGENYRANEGNKKTTREGGVKYSFVGRNKDGIEVYETSEEVKRMSWKDRKQHFLRIMRDQYRGRTAKFIRNGHAHYATFEYRDVSKNIYGDTSSDQKGRDAKIKVGADGNIFELVENSRYLRSAPELGKNHRMHRGVNYWDYYVKTVQIDGIVFDLIANVRKKADGEYVYVIELQENKEIEPSLPEGSQNSGLNGAPNSSTPSIRDVTPEVKEKFSMRDPVEYTKNLVALHNLTEDKLAKTLELGGFPMPSIAITKADIPHTNFGDITLVFGRETIDPKANRKNTVYSADAWTPVFPRTEYEEDQAVGSAISKRLIGLEKKIDDHFRDDLRRVYMDIEGTLNRYDGEEGLIQYAMDNYGLKAAYLEEQGAHIEKAVTQVEAEKDYNPDHADRYRKIADILGVKTGEEMGAYNLKEARDEHGDELEAILPGVTKSAFRMARIFGAVRAYLNDQGAGPVYKTVTDAAATRKAVDDSMDMAAYEAWVRNLFAGIVKDSGIYNNKPIFTPSGNMRSFKQTHLPVTLENIVKAMASQNGGSTKNVSGFNGIKTLRAGTAERFKSIEAMHQREGRLQNLTQEELEAVNDALQSRLYDIIKAIDDENGGKGSDNSLIRYDTIGEIITEISEGGKFNVSDIQQSFRGYGKEVSDDTALALKQLLFDVAQMPVNIFEAKPERVVGLNEIKAAILPNGTSQKVVEKLEQNGVPVQFYETGNDAERVALVNGMEDAKFSERDAGAEKVAAALKRQNAKLKEDVKYLKELLKLQKSVTGGTKFTRSSVEAAARLLMRSVDAKGDVAELSKLLNGFYEYIAKGEELTWESVMEMAKPVSDWLMNHMVERKELDGFASDVLQDIRGSRFYLDDQQKQNVAYTYGSYNDYRKKMMGTAVVTDKANMSLDSWWHEMSDLYPSVFDPTISSSDMPEAFADAVSKLRSMEIDSNKFWIDMDMMARDIMYQVYDSYWNVSTLKTVADVKQRQIDDLKSRHAAHIEKIRKGNRDARKRLQEEFSEKLRAVKKEMRKTERENVQKAVERQREIADRRRDNAQKAAMRIKIRKVIRDLDKIFSKGDKHRNVKEGLQDVVATALASAEVLFTDGGMSDYDMIRNGFRTPVSERESKLINRASDLLKQLDDPDVEQLLKDIDDPEDIQGAAVLAEQQAKVRKELYGITKQLQEAFERERKAINNTLVTSIIEDLAKAYKALENSPDPYISGAYRAEVYELLHSLYIEGNIFGFTRVKDMNLEQMGRVYDAYEAVLTTVRDANKLFDASIKETRQEFAEKVMIEESIAARRKAKTKLGRTIEKFAWDNLKPVYAFERIGSATLSKLYGNIRKGQDSWAVDMEEANQFRLEAESKYGFNEWDMEKGYDFVNPNGKKFTLTLPQIMSIYAYSKRPHAYDHLTKGGIVFADNTMTTVTKAGIKFHMMKEDATAYRLSMDTLTEIIGTLKKEQTDYVDEMQKYLSEVMGEKGNSVSMKLYGIKLFNEEHYFPLRSSEIYSKKTKEANFQKEQGQINLVNSGFAKALTPKASNPIILDSFEDVWSDHVNDMSLYHSFVLPMEDFRRVYNYKTAAEGEDDVAGVAASIQNAHGKAAIEYIDQLYRDLNGGALTDPREGIAKALTGKFKKAAVMASLSVVFQQPSSIGRAFAEIDLKHFESFGLVRGVSRAVFKHKDHDRQWAELKRYAPVAMIKEMGYFDTGMGLTAKEYLQAKEYSGIKEKAKAVFTDGKYRDELLGKAASVADELTWVEIWRAVKNETAARNPKMDKTSEEFLKIAGDRFSEVIDKTQVYDSVLARSANMRSKSLFMNMATSFMAEPTTTINMIEDALRKGAKGQKKYAARVMGAVFCSIVINAALSSLVYAGRDDDEDETYLEKYLSRFLTEIIDGVNPLTYFPFLKDVWSIAQGFDVERADMSLVSDAIEAINKLDKLLDKDTSDMSDEEIKEHRKALAEGWMSAVDVVASLLGIPLKNARREVNGAVNLFGTLKEDLGGRKTTWGSLGDVLQRDIADTLPAWWRPDTESKSERLYDAIVRGDDAYVERIMSTYADKDKAEAAIRAVIKDRYIAGEVSKLDARQMLINYGGVDVVKAHWTMDEWDYDKENTSEGGDDYGKYDRFFSAVETGAGLKAVIQEYTANGVSEGTLRKQITEHFKPLYVDMSTADRASLKGYLLNAMEACGQDREKAELNLMKWDFEAKYGYTWDDRGAAYRNGAITGTQLVKEMMTIAGKTQAEAELEVEVYDWQKDIPNCEITASGVADYHENCEAVGISRKTFYTAWRYYKDTSGDMDEETGEPIPYSKVRKVLPYIGGLDLTPEQKTALALCWWPASTVRQYKTW